VRLISILIVFSLLQTGSTGLTVLTGSSLPENTVSASNLDGHPAGTIRRFQGLKQRIADRRTNRLQKPVWHASLGSMGKTVAQKQTEKIPSVFDQPDIRLKHRLLASNAIGVFPAQCHGFLQNFFVRYDNPESRGLGGKSTIILDGNVPDDEFRALFIHEFGHLVDLGCLTGTPESGPSAFIDGADVMYNNDPSVAFYNISWSSTDTKRKGVRSEDFVSGYASWDPFEDLAESVSYFALQNHAFAERAKENAAIAAKYNWIATYVFSNTATIAFGQSEWKGQVPWDTTKLPYVWNAGQVALR